MVLNRSEKFNGLLTVKCFAAVTLMCRFVPAFLKKSGILATKIGSGEVIYNAVYANINYYNNAGKGKQGTTKGGLRGKFWFERMKADHLQDILKTAKEKAGGK